MSVANHPVEMSLIVYVLYAFIDTVHIHTRICRILYMLCIHSMHKYVHTVHVQYTVPPRRCMFIYVQSYSKKKSCSTPYFCENLLKAL